MCLAIPGKIESINENDDPQARTGVVSFGGVKKEINLVFVPNAGVGEYVIVHAGFALSVVDEEEALAVLGLLQELSEQEKA